MTVPTKHRVIIRRCRRYDAERIATILKQGMEALNVRPRGRILLKPNAVIAHPTLFPHAFTRKEFLEGALTAARSMAVEVDEIAVGERSGITIPTRFCFKGAGYPPVIRNQHARTYYFEEHRQVPVDLRGPERLRRRISVPEPVARADFLINVPKFKAHPWSRMTLSLKNFIGLQDDRHRLIDHNQFLEHKIADLQEVIQAGFIAVDGISAGQKMMLTPTPFALNAVIMGTNACAVDAVGCHMVHVDPESVIHLKMASERGYGPIDLAQIEISGDYPLEEIRRKTEAFGFCVERIDRYFAKDGPLSCTVGRFPEAHSPDYCWGGCPGALQEAMHIMRAFTPDAEQRMGKIRYVVGRVDEPLALKADERVLFAGDCTQWRGRLDGRPVEIHGAYRRPAPGDEDRTASNDMLKKMAAAGANCLRYRNARYLRARGCPVSVADHVNYLSWMGGLPNPNVDPRLVLSVGTAYWRMRLQRLLNRLANSFGRRPPIFF